MGSSDVFPHSGDLDDVHGSDGANVYAVGDEGTILHYDGVTWFSMRSGVEEALNGVWASPWSAVFAAGEKGRVLIRLGDRWIPMDTATDADLNAVGGSIEIAEHGVYAVGDGGVVIHFDGSAWSRIPLEEEANLNDLWVTREGMVYVVGDGGLILRYRNSQWSYMESGTDQDLNVVVGRRPGSGRRYRWRPERAERCSSTTGFPGWISLRVNLLTSGDSIQLQG